MGFGGILASIAQGFGGGMMKVADEAWKKQAEERKYQFYAEENEKDRKSKLAIATQNVMKNVIPHEKDITFAADFFKGSDIRLEELKQTENLLTTLPKDSSEYKIAQRKKEVLTQQIKDLINDKKMNKLLLSGHLGHTVQAEWERRFAPFRGDYEPIPEKVEKKATPNVQHPKATTGTYAQGQGFKTQNNPNYGSVSYGYGLR